VYLVLEVDAFVPSVTQNLASLPLALWAKEGVIYSAILASREVASIELA
jgi:hypothetical protein